MPPHQARALLTKSFSIVFALAKLAFFSVSAFANCDKGIYFVAPHPDGSSAVRLHSFVTGKDTTIAEIRKRVSWGLSVSPDERYILYTQFDQLGSDLMLVENFR